MRHFTGEMFLEIRNPVTIHLFISSFDIHHREGFYMKKLFKENLSGKFMKLLWEALFAEQRPSPFCPLHCLNLRHRSPGLKIPYLNHGDNNCTYITGSKYCEVWRKWRMWRMWDNGNWYVLNTYEQWPLLLLVPRVIFAQHTNATKRVKLQCNHFFTSAIPGSEHTQVSLDSDVFTNGGLELKLCGTSPSNSRPTHLRHEYHVLVSPV